MKKYTTEEFNRLVQTGRGEAVLFLKEERDKAPYKDIVIGTALRDDRYDHQCSDSRAWYITELVKCFDDAEDIAKRISQAYSEQKIKIPNGYFDDYYIKTLVELVKNGFDSPRNVIAAIYQDRYNGLLQKPDSFIGEERLYFIFAAEAMYDASIEPYEYIKEDFRSLLKKNKLKQSDYDAFCNYVTHEYKAVSNPIKTISFNEAVEWVKAGKTMTPYMCNSIFPKEFTQEQTDTLVNLISNEEDLELKLNYYRMAYSLPSETVIADAKQYEHALFEYGTPEKGLARAFVIEVLRHLYTAMNLDLSLQYARELEERCISTDIYPWLKCQRLSVEDRRAYAEFVKSLPISRENRSWHIMFGDVIDSSNKGDDADIKLLYHIYENSICEECRMEAVRQMAALGCLTDEIRKAGIYDSEHKTRELCR